MWNKIRRRLALLSQLHTLADGWLFGQLLLFAAFVPCLMWIKLPRLSTLLSFPRKPTLPAEADVAKLIRYTDLAMDFGTPVVRKRCLTRGITLYYFLQRIGAPVELQFGVVPADNLLTGHCWLMRNDLPLAEKADPRTHYTLVWSLPVVKATG